MPPQPRLTDVLHPPSPGERQPLPPGQLVRPRDSDRPVLWLSDGPTAVGLWASLRAEHAATGLWPLLITGDGWAEGGLRLDINTSPDDHDPAAVLALWWADHTQPDDEDEDEITAPYGSRWPGLAPPGRAHPSAHLDQIAGECAHLIARESTRIGLVPAPRGADALTALGWLGPANLIDDVAPISAVVRTWEDRFGARVLGIGPDTLDLSVAAPPLDLDHALRVAAEHFAFCPDNIWQGNPRADTLAAYAESILAVNHWSFWWD